MPSTRATLGYLATFSVGSPLAAVLEVKRIVPQQVNVPEVEATHLLSPNATEEYIPGLIKPGTVEIGGNFVGDSTQLNFLALAKARTVFAFAFTAPVDSATKTYTCSGTGFVQDYSSGPFETKDVSQFVMKLKITGTITESVA